MQCLFGSSYIVFAKLGQGEREVVLVVIGIPIDGVPKNFERFGCVSKVRVDISEKSEIRIVLLPRGRDFLRNFQRFYGLPLAQTILKLPAGAVTAVAGMLLLQHGVLGSVGPVDWPTAMAYAVLLGVAQIAVTKRIDSRANDLLGDANSKSPATAQVTVPSDGS